VIDRAKAFEAAGCNHHFSNAVTLKFATESLKVMRNFFIVVIFVFFETQYEIED
jgi:hypothetical protein